MPVQLLSPESMLRPVPYAHVSVATGSRHVHVAGQIGRDPDTGDLADDLVARELDLPQPMPPASLIGVEILFEADVLVEAEAYAVLD